MCGDSSSDIPDGYTSCTLKELIGCDACIAGNEGRKINEFSCEHMTDTGCERMITAKNLILDEIIAGGGSGALPEQCCIGCTRSCGYRCGQGIKAKRRKENVVI